MASSVYQSWSVVAGETPTTAKWNLLGSNDASFNSGVGFNDGIIVPRHFDTTSNSAWIQWTPTFSGFTLGNGTVDAAYTQIGKFVAFRIIVVGGNSTALNGGFYFTLPVNAKSNYLASARLPIGVCELEDSGVNNYPGVFIMPTVNSAQVLYYYVAGTARGLNWTGTSNNTPFAFNTNDTLQGQGMYEAA